MKKRTIVGMTTAFLVVLCLTFPVQAAPVDVEVTNLTHGVYFTPLLVTAHDGSTHLFSPGAAASASLRLMAECGDISALVADVGGADPDTVINPAGGLLAPGASTTAALDTTRSRLSVVAMLLPTNDGFVGLDALDIPSKAGTYIYYLNAYDAGTEANNELLDTSGCTPGQVGIPAAPGGDAGTAGTGVAATDANATVHVHRGNLGDTDPAGGSSDLDSRIHRWLNPVARVVITIP
jgi:hypothetical protein